MPAIPRSRNTLLSLLLATGLLGAPFVEAATQLGKGCGDARGGQDAEQLGPLWGSLDPQIVEQANQRRSNAVLWKPEAAR